MGGHIPWLSKTVLPLYTRLDMLHCSSGANPRPTGLNLRTTASRISAPWAFFHLSSFNTCYDQVGHIGRTAEEVRD
jgi:hypothetical protein